MISRERTLVKCMMAIFYMVSLIILLSLHHYVWTILAWSILVSPDLREGYKMKRWERGQDGVRPATIAAPDPGQVQHFS